MVSKGLVLINLDQHAADIPAGKTLASWGSRVGSVFKELAHPRLWNKHVCCPSPFGCLKPGLDVFGCECFTTYQPVEHELPLVDQ